ncbi:cell number regulator 6-like isoform X1 [Rhododendron vialii]|uniref:cell number regulator 6-like isoform X1 n=1 Tax=Rhododendron vialii TaxID=182163 RepID=UPI00265EEC9B|nr:cell number regulator 6-like isoform X1 [Rhododendron vialii]
MEEGGVQARYVKLTRKQAEVIRPGELNQAIHVPQLHRKCSECRQPLPERFVFPKDEPWTTGIFGCAEDTESCWTGLLCPCVLFGRNVQRIRDDANCIGPCMCHAVVIEGGIALAAATAAFYGFDPSTSLLICEGLLFSWGICGLYTGLFRQWLQRKYHLKSSPCGPCLVHCCMHSCALCQEHREMNGRLSDGVVVPRTIVNPPPVQEMNSANDSSGTSAPSVQSVDHASLEMQAS